VSDDEIGLHKIKQKYNQQRSDEVPFLPSIKKKLFRFLVRKKV
jgi:hypothetical protein